MLKYVRPYTGTLAHKFHLYIFLGPSKRKKNISLEVFVSLTKKKIQKRFYNNRNQFHFTKQERSDKHKTQCLKTTTIQQGKIEEERQAF